MSYSVSYCIIDPKSKNTLHFNGVCFSDIFPCLNNYKNYIIRVNVLDDYEKAEIGIGSNKNILTLNEHILLAQLLTNLLGTKVNVIKSDAIMYYGEHDKQNIHPGLFYEFKLKPNRIVQHKIALTIIRYSFETLAYPEANGILLHTFFKLLSSIRVAELHNLLLLAHYIGYCKWPGGHDLMGYTALIPCTKKEWRSILKKSGNIQDSLKSNRNLPYPKREELRDLLISEKYEEAYTLFMSFGNIKAGNNTIKPVYLEHIIEEDYDDYDYDDNDDEYEFEEKDNEEIEN